VPSTPDRPVFVVGCGRSGTTVLYEVLCEHPELAWFSNWSEQFPGRSSVALLHRARRLGRPAKGSPVWSRWRPHPVEGYASWDHCTGLLPGGLDRPLAADDVTEAARARAVGIVGGHVRFQGASRFVNKNTRNARRIPYLASVFPDACFVHVVRHPVEVARSLAEVAFWADLPIWWADGRTPRQLTGEGVDPLVLAARFWSRELEVVRRDRAGIPTDRFLDVRYEALLDRPQPVLAGLSAAIEIDPSAAVSAAAAARLTRGRGPTARPELSRDALDAIWAEVADEALAWGYEPG
jgi:hypothetical protein